ncbi:MAG: DNA-binding Lrp family transcriptional regulator [Bacteriovoracaceae bacterium]|jgi:DNA-binding Lrp family transcriptional regulator
MRELSQNYDYYAPIINTIGNWKILGIKDLHDKLELPLSYKTLRNKLLKLENGGVVKSTKLHGPAKYVYLSDKGIALTQNDRTYEPCDETIVHDVIVGRVVQDLLKYSKVNSAKLFHQIKEKAICPDAFVLVSNKDKEYKIGIEVELTQKSRSRVQEKYSEYSNSLDYDYCVYFSHKTKLIEAYQRFLNEMNANVREKVFLVHSEKLLRKVQDLTSSNCYFDSESIDFEKLFGEKVELPKVIPKDTNHLRTKGNS